MLQIKKKNITKNDIGKNISKTIGIPFIFSKKITNNIILCIIDVILLKKEVNIKSLGSFRIIKKNQRIGRNPKTKKEYLIPAQNSISFKISNLLKNKLNSNN